MNWLRQLAPRDLRYQLSNIIPVPMRSTYQVIASPGRSWNEHATWWQWRRHIIRHRIHPT